MGGRDGGKDTRSWSEQCPGDWLRRRLCCCFALALIALAITAPIFSRKALDDLRQQLSVAELTFPNVTLTQQVANNFDGIDVGAFDTVILNSVVQYFPSVAYLVQVLEGALRCLRPGGKIFLGDLRSLPLLRAFHTSVQLHKAASSLPVSELQQLVEKEITQEKEL